MNGTRFLSAVQGAVRRPPLSWYFCPPLSPWVPVGFYGPLAVAAVAWNLARAEAAPWQVAVLVAGGVLVWTLLEYVLHRIAFHVPFGFPLLRAVRGLHGEHHDEPTDPRHILTRPAFSFPAAVLFWGLFRLLLPSWPLAALPTAGIAIGYVGYEVIHYLIHHYPRFRPLRALARHHLHHHFKDPTRCFGVSTRLWDVVFRTGR